MNAHRTHDLQEDFGPICPHLLQPPLLIISRCVHIPELLKLLLPRPPGSNRVPSPLLLDEIRLRGVSRKVSEFIPMSATEQVRLQRNTDGRPFLDVAEGVVPLLGCVGACNSRWGLGVATSWVGRRAVGAGVKA